MVTFKRFLKEGKVEKLTNKRGNSFPVYVNPNVEAVKNAKSTNGTFRTIKHENKHYMWDAYHATHDFVAKQLGLEDYSHGYFYDKDLRDNNYDVKKCHTLYECINEGKVYNLQSFDKPVRVYQNPSKEQMKNIHDHIKSHEEYAHVRTLKNGNDHYVWNANDSIHETVASQLNIPSNDRGWIHVDKFSKHNFDLSTVHKLYNDRAWDADTDESTRYSPKTGPTTGIDSLMRRFKEIQKRQ